MAATLPGLLDALAHLFARPGFLPVEVLEAALGAPWLDAAAAEALAALPQPEGEDLAVAYASHFLVGRDRPVLHLEEGAHPFGRLSDPNLEAGLRALYSAWAFTPTGPAEHLATQLEALGQLLRHPELPTDSRIRSAGLRLLETHTLPFLNLLVEPRIGGTYGAALQLSHALAQLCADGIHSLDPAPEAVSG